MYNSADLNTGQQELKAADLTSYPSRNQRKMRDAASQLPFPNYIPGSLPGDGTSHNGRIFPSQNNQGSFLKTLQSTISQVTLDPDKLIVSTIIRVAFYPPRVYNIPWIQSPSEHHSDVLSPL